MSGAPRSTSSRSIRRSPRALVVVEVRWRASRSFGLGEETVDRRKRARLRAAAWRWLEEHDHPTLPLRVDLVIVEPGPRPGASGVSATIGPL